MYLKGGLYVKESRILVDRKKTSSGFHLNRSRAQILSLRFTGFTPHLKQTTALNGAFHA